MSGGAAAGTGPTSTVDRVVVIHGAADQITTSALASAGLVVRLEVGDTTVWAPARWDQVEAPIPSAGFDDRPDVAPRLLLTVAEAAAALGIGRTTAYELVGSGQLEVVHVGRCARVPVEAVKELVDRLRQGKALRSHPAGTVALPGTLGASQRAAASPDRLAGQAS